MSVEDVFLFSFCFSNSRQCIRLKLGVFCCWFPVSPAFDSEFKTRSPRQWAASDPHTLYILHTCISPWVLQPPCPKPLWTTRKKKKCKLNYTKLWPGDLPASPSTLSPPTYTNTHIHIYTHTCDVIQGATCTHMPARILLLVQISTIAKRTKQKECLREKQTQEMYVCD